MSDLSRFVDAQARVYDDALSELRAGRKTSHWMWFVFPQIAGLGRSPTAQRYAIASLAEAEAYVAHPVLGERLRECARVLTELEGRSAEQVFGGLDALKLRSSMTLFARAAPDEPLFRDVLDALLRRRGGPGHVGAAVKPYTHIHLLDVEDAAPANGFGERWEARVARTALEAEQTGVTHFRLRPGMRSPFTHRHVEAEEVYVILAGSGKVKLDDEVADVRPLDAIRVAPQVARAFEAGPDGLELLAFGPHHADGEPVDDPWTA